MSYSVTDTTPLLGDKVESGECMSMVVVPAKSAPNSITSPSTPTVSTDRLTSLDQYRGFVILCSLIVPLLGQLNAAPSLFRHPGNFFSIAGSCTAVPRRHLNIIGSYRVAPLRKKKDVNHNGTPLIMEWAVSLLLILS